MGAADIRRAPLQVINYAVFMAVVGYFSLYPAHRRLADDEAVVTLAFGHAGARIAECRTLSQSDIDELAPNMRQAFDCPRERSPLVVELTLDDEVAASLALEAPGIYNDQGVDVYRDIKVSAGAHHLAIWLNDDVNVEGPTHRFEQAVNLEPAQRLVITFDPSKGGFALR
ncbi:MAG: hypothetical protein DWQ08_05515 [Proteobacteria bacterium]|nr:MAG: hypothetical protein DWQ08_05515 [Pseudomonadota bacterium]